MKAKHPQELLIERIERLEEIAAAVARERDAAWFEAALAGLDGERLRLILDFRRVARRTFAAIGAVQKLLAAPRER